MLALGLAVAGILLSLWRVYVRPPAPCDAGCVLRRRVVIATPARSSPPPTASTGVGISPWAIHAARSPATGTSRAKGVTRLTGYLTSRVFQIP